MLLKDYLNQPGQSQARLAEKVGVTQSAVSQWLASRVPTDRVRDVVMATAGIVTAHDIRPEIFPEGFEFPRAQAVEV